MRYDLYRKRRLPVRSGVVESACKQIVGSRFKKACRRAKAEVNALLAVKRCIENNRRLAIINCRDCSVTNA